MRDDDQVEMSSRESGPRDLSQGALETARVKTLLQALVASGDILVDPTRLDALVDDIVELDSAAPGAGMRTFALLMEHDDVEEIFLSQDELAAHLEAK